VDTFQNQDSTIFTDTPPVYGGFWARFGAAIIDGLILIIPMYFLNSYATFASPFRGSYYDINLLSTIVGWLYCALQESGPAQATIGKRALGLRVVNEHGQRISFGQATGRHFAKWVSIITLFIGYLMMLWNDRRQTLHDMMAGTFIVEA